MKEYVKNRQEEPNYKGFVEHLWEYEEAGVPLSIKDKVELAEKYGCPTSNLARAAWVISSSTEVKPL